MPKKEKLEPILEYSKSSKSRCRICKQFIPKGEVRLGIPYVFRKKDEEITAYGWYHLKCALEKQPETVLEALENSSGLDKATVDRIRDELVSRGIIQSDDAFLKIDKITPAIERANLKVVISHVFPARPDLLVPDIEVRPLYCFDDTGMIKVVLMGKWLEQSSNVEVGDSLVIKRGLVFNPYDVVVEIRCNDESEVVLQKA